MRRRRIQGNPPAWLLTRRRGGESMKRLIAALIAAALFVPILAGPAGAVRCHKRDTVRGPVYWCPDNPRIK
jgi:hypothetical protein